MMVKDKLKEYYSLSPFDDDGDISNDYVNVYAGPYLLTIRNTNKRREVIVYHDLHHVFTGYTNSRIGEGEVGAWELGTDCWNRPVAVLYNLSGMATGLCGSPKRIKKAFLLGCHQKNLYDLNINMVLENDEEYVRDYITNNVKEPSGLRCKIRYYFYFAGACFMLPLIFILGFINSKLGSNG